jgi:hypothetical protein
MWPFRSGTCEKSRQSHSQCSRYERDGHREPVLRRRAVKEHVRVLEHAVPAKLGQAELAPLPVHAPPPSASSPHQARAATGTHHGMTPAWPVASAVPTQSG